MTLRKTAGFWPVFAALVGNTFVTVIKFAAAFISAPAFCFQRQSIVSPIPPIKPCWLLAYAGLSKNPTKNIFMDMAAKDFFGP